MTSDRWIIFVVILTISYIPISLLYDTFSLGVMMFRFFLGFLMVLVLLAFKEVFKRRN